MDSVITRSIFCQSITGYP